MTSDETHICGALSPLAPRRWRSPQPPAPGAPCSASEPAVVTIGARPFNRTEQERMYKRDGKVWKVSDDPFDAELYRIKP